MSECRSATASRAQLVTDGVGLVRRRILVKLAIRRCSKMYETMSVGVRVPSIATRSGVFYLWANVTSWIGVGSGRWWLRCRRKCVYDGYLPEDGLLRNKRNKPSR